MKERRYAKTLITLILMVMLVLHAAGCGQNEASEAGEPPAAASVDTAAAVETLPAQDIDQSEQGKEKPVSENQSAHDIDQPEQGKEQPASETHPAQNEAQADETRPVQDIDQPEQGKEKPASETWGEQGATEFDLSMVPAYSGTAYADINEDIPFFTEEEMTTEPFQEYWPLDDLGRCTGAYACVGPETLPTEKRGEISSVKPSGWHTVKYDGIDGNYLYNRCHLIGYQLTGQNAEEKNLITGTRYMNTQGMLPFEESVFMYVEGTGNHVMYRVRPYFDGDDLLARGVLMEARSVEDPLVQFCAFCYNVQPGVEIDYATGDSTGPEFTGSGDKSGDDKNGATGSAQNSEESQKGAERADEADQVQEIGAESVTDGAQTEDREVRQDVTYIINTNSGKFHRPTCDSVHDMSEKNKLESTDDRETLIERGYVPCKRCKP